MGGRWLRRRGGGVEKIGDYLGTVGNYLITSGSVQICLQSGLQSTCTCTCTYYLAIFIN